MQIQATAPANLARTAPAAPEAPAAPAEPKDGFSPTKVVAGGILTFMGRRIPTTVPEMSQERIDNLKSAMQPGDVLLTCDCAYPGWARMEFWTVRSNYTHAAFYAGDGRVLEAVGDGVIENTLEKVVSGRSKVAVIRPPYKSAADVQAATAFCESHLGKQYDSVFNTSDEKEFYCSELVAKALQSMPNPIDTPMASLLGKPFIAPDAFLSLSNATLVHDDKSDYWKNKLGHWPLACSALGGAAAGGALAGMGGAGIGFGVGLLGSILIGNKIQTGHFLPSLTDR